MKEYGKLVSKGSTNFEDDAFHYRCWVYANKLQPALVHQRLVKATPPVVQWLLGMEKISSKLLPRHAPRAYWKAYKGLRAVYGNFAKHNADKKVADYIGSSGQLWTRIRGHLRSIFKYLTMSDMVKRTSITKYCRNLAGSHISVC